MPITDAERARRYRARRRAGAVIVPVTVSPHVIRGLRAPGFIAGGPYDPHPPVADLAPALEKLLAAAGAVAALGAALYPGEPR